MRCYRHFSKFSSLFCGNASKKQTHPFNSQYIRNTQSAYDKTAPTVQPAKILVESLFFHSTSYRENLCFFFLVFVLHRWSSTAGENETTYYSIKYLIAPCLGRSWYYTCFQVKHTHLSKQEKAFDEGSKKPAAKQKGRLKKEGKEGIPCLINYGAHVQAEGADRQPDCRHEVVPRVLGHPGGDANKRKQTKRRGKC